MVSSWHVTLSASEGSLRLSWRFFAAKGKSAAQNDMPKDDFLSARQERFKKFTSPESTRRGICDDSVLSSSRCEWQLPFIFAEFGTITFVWLPKLQRVGPSASLDKSEYLIARVISRRFEMCQELNVVPCMATVVCEAKEHTESLMFSLYDLSDYCSKENFYALVSPL